LPEVAVGEVIKYVDSTLPAHRVRISEMWGVPHPPQKLRSTAKEVLDVASNLEILQPHYKEKPTGSSPLSSAYCSTDSEPYISVFSVRFDLRC
jgi:hypothetical protein